MKQNGRVRLIAAIVCLTTLVAARAARAGENLCDPSFDNCRNQLLSLINNETVGIDVAFWFMTDDRYAQAIVARWQAGVPVRVLVDPRANPTYTGNAYELNELASAGIPMRYRTASGILHWKMMLFSGQQTVEFGSANYADPAFVPIAPYTNYVDETVYYSDDPAVVQSFMTKYDDSWTDTSNFANYANINGPLVRNYPTYPIDPDLNFPPSQDFGKRNATAINNEKQQIDVLMYRITDSRHTDAILNAWARGVPIRIIVENKEYHLQQYLWDAWNVDKLYAAGIPMKWRGHDGQNHEKLELLYGQGMTVFGSSNWTSASATSQLEHNYFTTKSWIFTWFEDQFNRMWNNSNPAGAIETVPFVPLPPDKPTNISPANAGTVSTSTTTLTWYPGPWGVLYDVYFGTSSTPPLVASNLNLGPATSSTNNKTWTTPTLTPGTTYYWQIVSRTNAGLTATGPVWSFTVPGSGGGGSTLPSPWADVDVGAVGLAGSASYNNGTFTVSGSGADIWSSADAFNYVYEPFNGDGQLVARVAAVSNTNAWAKAGVMFRSTLDAGSAYALMAVTPGKGIAFQYRTSAGASATGATPIGGTAPYWVKIVRSGATFTGYASPDGSTWTQVGQATVSMGASIYVGLAVSAHSNTALCSATFDNVSTGSGAIGGLPSPWVDSDIGSVGVPGSGSYSSGTFNVTGSGADIWNSSDAFNYAYEPLNGDGQLVARVVSNPGANAWAKAGVMIRNTLDANSAYALMLVSAGKGTAFQYRASAGTPAASIAGTANAAPYWVMVVRSGTTVSGYQSPDGTTWTLIGQVTISMNTSVYVGLAVTSHDNTTSVTATFDNVQ